MTAITVVPCPRRSNAFTIDSIIGKDSEKTEPSTSQNSHTKFRVTENVHVDRIHRKEVDIDDGDVLHVVLPGRNVRDLRDIRDFVFYNDASRDILETMAPGNSLKHFHDAFLHNTVPCGSSRLCRHPLSSLNGPGMHSQQIPSVSPIHPMVLNSTRDFRHMYPYLADRYLRYFMPRFGVPGTPGLHFHPYRKPKRIRTAFLPSQLLQLEKAFEKSHYVVGQERKDLAAELQLSETQIKVWFQNRRTKVKRVKTEEEESESSVNGSPRDKSLNQSNQSDSDSVCDISDIYS